MYKGLNSLPAFAESHGFKSVDECEVGGRIMKEKKNGEVEV